MAIRRSYYVDRDPTGFGFDVQIERNGMRSKVYPTRDEAFKFAVSAAEAQSAAQHRDADVFVRGDDGEFHLKWSYMHGVT
ncbi:hypothetical protein BA190_26925 [Labrys sp. WJW]|uniref:DUF2188 domain-containing protein n=1 Tax=Labrys sp. WJW TaxID=1737983 RepID=UPI000835D27F|nr:DUF2188 domain-containing protein [Labrys sp. WJW]OCC01849.1 hypothetical protein BA190_26925 [Labrys sp. WJW]